MNANRLRCKVIDEMYNGIVVIFTPNLFEVIMGGIFYFKEFFGFRKLVVQSLPMTEGHNFIPFTMNNEGWTSD